MEAASGAHTDHEADTPNGGDLRASSELRLSDATSSPTPVGRLLAGLGFLDTWLAAFILLAMILGVIIGEFAPNVQRTFTTVTFEGVSGPIVVGLIVMMWPILTKVQYERLPKIFSTWRVWIQLGISLVLNWVFGPLIMLGLAWATLPDLPTYRTGVIMVGLARCIAMVMVWNALAKGDSEYCALIVIVNSILQIILYSPYSIFFVNVIGNGSQSSQLHLEYGRTAIAVLIYLGIPLALGLLTRFTVITLTSRAFFTVKFLPYFSPLALLGLLYTIIIIFAEQSHRILHNIGNVFRVFVPMILYFVIMWTATFFMIWQLSKSSQSSESYFGYEMAVVQSFTAGSNNFELAIAVCIAVYGIDSDQALAATIGPLVEVPVLLSLTWLALFLRERLDWNTPVSPTEGGGISGIEKGEA
ncbi:hypothetical protein BOTBODRAFT_30601 [Botryobasidium botryosum FD-172 SS1]|uniref:Arsenical-resistance protein n=1 Tax=Botryobasidium botryosum (strain FD-172 SS1) TaxID=930990 RepID=A0A067MLQ0_BOTB1|nr:hypothetical protein BOTBODRAFT_30601 [Botryobasidium botryosum FD-172 SS1]